MALWVVDSKHQLVFEIVVWIKYNHGLPFLKAEEAEALRLLHDLHSEDAVAVGDLVFYQEVHRSLLGLEWLMNYFDCDVPVVVDAVFIELVEI